MNKKTAAVLLIIFIFTAAVFWFLRSKKAEAPAGEKNIPAEKTAYADLIQVSFPISGEKVGGTINVTGIARGTWYFEGEFPVYLTDAEGNQLAWAPARAQGEWMKEDFIPFSASLKYPVGRSAPAKLVLKRNNPSDIREQDAMVEIPVILEPETTSAKLFFMSQYFDKNASYCDQVFPAAREVFESMALAHQTLEDLLAGPTEEEKALGYGTAIPAGVTIQNFDASFPVARLDLGRELLNLKVDTACPRLLIQKQIEETVKGVSGAESVVITVDGQPFPGEFPDEGPTFNQR